MITQNIVHNHIVIEKLTADRIGFATRRSTFDDSPDILVCHVVSHIKLTMWTSPVSYIYHTGHAPFASRQLPCKLVPGSICDM